MFVFLCVYECVSSLVELPCDGPTKNNNNKRIRLDFFCAICVCVYLCRCVLFRSLALFSRFFFSFLLDDLLKILHVHQNVNDVRWFKVSECVCVCVYTANKILLLFIIHTHIHTYHWLQTIFTQIESVENLKKNSIHSTPNERFSFWRSPFSLFIFSICLDITNQNPIEKFRVTFTDHLQMAQWRECRKTERKKKKNMSHYNQLKY